ncbi:hypothetical protein [Pseudaestuariivita sp.]|uniref:hypothetical protein n=1 Tax=Pseudaestuariivita sp. TaxID=2211669 RepID=UPI004058BEAB
MTATVGLCAYVLTGGLGFLPEVALHYLFALSAVLALVCTLVLVLHFGIKTLRWALFLDDPRRVAEAGPV